MDGKRPTVSSLHGVVACSHPLAAQAGARMLGQGGNAFDAIVASAAALNVVEPFMSGIAGMGVATCHVAAERRIRTLDFVTTVPSQFPAGKFNRRDQMLHTPLAAGTPGNVAGWAELVSRYGRLSFAKVLEPAIMLAEDGFGLITYTATNINQIGALLRPLPCYADWNQNYTGGSGAVRSGQVLRQQDLAGSLRAIAAEGPGYMQGGPLGQRIAAHMQAVGGCLTAEDFAAVRPVWRDSVQAAYRGLTVHTVPPPGEGFQFLLTLRLLDGIDVAALKCGGVEHLDIVWRAIRIAAGERIAHNNPKPDRLAWLLSDENVARLRARLVDGIAVDGPTEQWVAPVPTHPAKGHTTSLSAADRQGNVVCITQSLGALFGCGVVVPGTGVCVNNFLYWGEADTNGTNPLLPGGPLALPMAPSVSCRGDRPVLALGTPGSYGICQTQAQVLVRHVDFGQGLQDAIEAPRARLWDGRRVQAESRFEPETLEALRGRGHAIDIFDPWMMPAGSMQGIAIDPETGVMTGGADPRRAGYVATA